MRHPSFQGYTLTQFSEYGLPAPLMKALGLMKFEKPTPVQKEAIPLALQGTDILATAQTGTGKTGAFAIPLLSQILNGSKKPVLVLAPTRELAEQISQVIKQLTQCSPEIRHSLIIGGTSYHHQIRDLRARPMFVIGTPGRLIDQIKLGNLNLKAFGALVIDEADRLLDMGFAQQLEEIVANLPSDRQTMMFSATLPPEIQSLSARYMKAPASIAIGSVNKPIEAIQQRVVETTIHDKGQTLLREIDQVAGSLIVFTRTKDRADRVTRLLNDAGHEAAALHGDLSQNRRRRAVDGLRQGRYRILVATDIAARGIDIPHIRHVINYDLPMCPEDYVHRIGRTGRAGSDGNALAFVTPEDRQLWKRIYRLMYGKNPEGMEYVERRHRPKTEQKFSPKKKKSSSSGKSEFGKKELGAKSGPRSEARQEQRPGAKKTAPKRGAAKKTHTPAKSASAAAPGRESKDRSYQGKSRSGRRFSMS